MVEASRGAGASRGELTQEHRRSARKQDIQRPLRLAPPSGVYAVREHERVPETRTWSGFKLELCALAAVAYFSLAEERARDRGKL